MPTSRDISGTHAAAAQLRRTPFVRSVARAIETSDLWSKDLATFTSAASASSFASRSSTRNANVAARASSSLPAFPRHARS